MPPNKLLQLAIVFVLIFAAVWIGIQRSSPPSNLNLIWSIGIPVSVAIAFQTRQGWKAGFPGNVLQAIAWAGLLYLWGFFSVMLSLAILGT